MATVIFEDVLRTLKHQLEGKVSINGRQVPINIDYPDPDWVQDNRPCIGVLWYSLERNRSRDANGLLIEKDLDNMTATIEPYPQYWDMYLQFDLFSLSTLQDIRGMAQLLEALEALQYKELRTETLGERIRLRYLAPFRDSRDREFHSGVRYAVTVPLRIAELKREYPLVQNVLLRMYKHVDLSELDRELEVL